MVAKGFLVLPNLHMLMWQKSPSIHKNLAPGTFGKLLSVLSRGKSAISPLFNGLEVLSFVSNKVKLFGKNFSKNSNLDSSGFSLPAVPSRTNLKLHKISVTVKIVKNLITELDIVSVL